MCVFKAGTTVPVLLPLEFIRELSRPSRVTAVVNANVPHTRQSVYYATNACL